MNYLMKLQIKIVDFIVDYTPTIFVVLIAILIISTIMTKPQ